ncbi:hypothetical protein E6C76_10870 [Pseudothauera nasutitermitis]|uniref:Secreted protein n=1 Tax=Pseudothauera nasutitermitis TaxID=2565930 RepID=A0A4V3WBU1_9RHOO|nr:hypothetical protein [Pseudothauera nasutitermitis]THF64559.1 hypothetical protein E6C76_10870 [Pseudothauera nasutitermitis]
MRYPSFSHCKGLSRFVAMTALGLCAWTPGAFAQQVDPYRLMVREQFFKSLVDVCSRLHGDDTQQYRKLLQGWQAQNRQQLEPVMRELTQGNGNSDRLGKALEVERRTLEDWQTNQMKVSRERTPSKAECGRMLESLSRLSI